MININPKKAQAWGFDLMIASTIFIGGILAFYLYTLNVPTESEGIIDKLSYEGNSIADIILSNGFPENWNEGDVITPGILTSNRINQTKLERLNTLSLNNYEKTKLLFNTNFEYYITTSKNFTINGEEKEGIGSKPINERNLIKVTRITIYNDELITLNINIWE